MSLSTTTERVFNFSAGPAVLPQSVLEQIRDEMIALPGVGSSVLEISHRGKPFQAIIEDARQRLVQLLSIPDDYDVLMLQGGATLQNALIPANLITDPNQVVDFVLTGAWGTKASQDVPFYGRLNVAWSGQESQFNRIPEASEIEWSPDAAYAHVTSNETIHGVQFTSLPDPGNAPLVVDHSSDFLWRPMDVRQYGLMYACAQKNCGISGLTVLVIRKDLLERSGGRLPRYLDFAAHAKAGSMLNTPPTFAIYVSGLVFRWIQEEIGGLEQMEELNRRKAALLYDTIDAYPEFYLGHAQPECRSQMNVVFRLPSSDLETVFLDQAAAAGMTTLKGHRSLGGIRASIYNAMPLEGVHSLAQFMQDFVKQNG